MLQNILAALRRYAKRALGMLAALWRRFRALPRWGQAIVVAVILLVIWGLVSLLGGSAPGGAPGALRTVTLERVGALSGDASGATVLGTVRARSEAEIRAEASGTVRAVYTDVGASVGAGAIIAELDNDSERAQVTQAEGAYDAALAVRAGVSPEDVDAAARNAYRTAFETLDTTLQTETDVLFGAPTPAGPKLLINPIGSDQYALSRERKRIDELMDAERAQYESSSIREPEVLLSGLETLARQIADFSDRLAAAANAIGSNASADQVAAAVSARARVSGVLSSLTAAQASLRSGASSSTASVDASVKSALGTLRLAQAALEKTRVRAPIAGTVNFLPIRVGDYVGTLDHVATVAQNGALEIVAFVSEESLGALAAGDAVLVDGSYEGVVTSVAPALDPVRKQIEVRVAVAGGSALVNGQSARITLPGAAAPEGEESGPVLLPLSAVKLSAGSRVVFTLGENGRLAALPVEIGEVRGERIEVLTPLPADLRIVTDARGLSDGAEVKVAETP